MSYVVGDTIISSKGQKMTILRYNGCNDIDVKLDTGEVLYNKRIFCLKKLSASKHKVGDILVSSKGQKMTILRYNGCNDIDVKLDTGEILYNKRIFSLKKLSARSKVEIGYSYINRLNQRVEVIAKRNGRYKVKIDNHIRKDYIDFLKLNNDLVYQPIEGLSESRLGEESVAYNGIPMKIIESSSARNIRVRFIDGIEYDSEYSIFSKSRKIRQVLRGSKIGCFTIDKFVYRLQDFKDVFYICHCDKCGYKDILTPIEMIEHKC